jgi:hypothetical protein
MPGIFRGQLRAAARASGGPRLRQPLFVLGFPRSGTTLLEQISQRTRRSARVVSCGRQGMARLVNQLLRRAAPFPSNLQEMRRSPIAATSRTLLRDHYLARAEQMGLLVPGAAFSSTRCRSTRFRCPLSAWHFPRRRSCTPCAHPLDVCVSMMSLHFKHGFHCGYRLEDIGLTWRRFIDCTSITVANSSLREFILRYESLVANPRPLLERCVRAHRCAVRSRRPALPRKRSVTLPRQLRAGAEPLNDRSMGRYALRSRTRARAARWLESLIAAGTGD